MRYARVQQVLSQELAFKGRLSQKTEAILKPDGTQELFSPEVIKITQAIHDNGKDAHKCQKIDVIKVAVKVFGFDNDEASEPPPAPPSPEPPKPEVKHNGAPAPVKKAAPPKPKPAPKPVAKTPPKPKATPTALPPAVVTSPTPPAPAPAEIAKAPEATPEVDSKVAVKAAVDAPTASRVGENTAAYNVYVSMYSLTLSSIQLCELFDHQPGKKERLKMLEELLEEFNKHISKSAKETQKA